MATTPDPTASSQSLRSRTRLTAATTGRQAQPALDTTPGLDSAKRLPSDGLPEAASSTATATATTIVTNILVSVSIVLVNKQILSTFPYPVFLTAIHQLTCLIITRLLPLFSVQAALAPPSPPPWRDAFLAGSSNVIGLSLMNVSLLANSVLVHQTAKLLGVPAVALVQSLAFDAKPPSRQASLALAAVLGGVAIVTSPSSPSASSQTAQLHIQPQQHWGGLIIAGGAVLTTAFAQAALQHMPSFRGVSGLRSVAIMSPYSTLTAFALSWVIEGRALFALTAMDHFPWLLLAVSSALAIAANVLGNALIRTTSAITYNVVGHVKTILIVAGGMLMDRHLSDKEGMESGAPGWEKVAGMAITMVGVAWYSRIQQQASSRDAVAGDRKRQ